MQKPLGHIQKLPLYVNHQTVLGKGHVCLVGRVVRKKEG